MFDFNVGKREVIYDDGNNNRIIKQDDLIIVLCDHNIYLPVSSVYAILNDLSVPYVNDNIDVGLGYGSIKNRFNEINHEVTDFLGEELFFNDDDVQKVVNSSYNMIKVMELSNNGINIHI